MSELNDNNKRYISDLLGYSLKFDSTGLLFDIDLVELNKIRNYKFSKNLSTELLEDFIMEYLKSKKVDSTQINLILSKIY